MTRQQAAKLEPGDMVVLGLTDTRAIVLEVHDGGMRVSILTEYGKNLTMRHDAIIDSDIAGVA